MPREPPSAGSAVGVGRVGGSLASLSFCSLLCVALAGRVGASGLASEMKEATCRRLRFLRRLVIGSLCGCL